MIRSIYIDQKGKRKTALTEQEIREALADPQGLVWVSLERPSHEEANAILRELFQFHPLAIEDSLNGGYQTPKVDDYGGYIFIIAHAIHCRDDYTKLETMELNLYLSSNFLVTVYLDDEMPPVASLWEKLERDERLTKNGADFLGYALLDLLVDAYMPVLDQMDDEIEWLEDQLLAQPNTKMLQRILDLKHTLMNLRRVMSPQREVLNRLSRDGFAMVDQKSRYYFRDIYDHLVRYQDLIESLRDIVSGALDIYLNSTSLRLNEVMKALTVVSTIFLPLSFVAGMFGMNFTRFFPAWDWPYGYALFWLICIGISLGMLAYFKKRGWF